jgi:hypothetical protein
MSPEVMSRIAIWRVKACDGTLTTEEMKEAIALIRGDRKSASFASEKSKAKKAESRVPDADDLLNELGGL